MLHEIEQAASRNAVPCAADATLPPAPAGARLFIASNLHDNEPLLPHYTLQLLQLLVALPPNSAYVSLYESGSADRTGARAKFVACTTW